MHCEEGAYTGEVTARMLHELGVGHVIVGHSERRYIFHEDDKLVNAKVKAALRHGLVPKLCVGEDRRERGSGRAVEVVLQQPPLGLADVKRKEIATVVIAYEPIWVIGMGRSAPPKMLS
jgi:triosephosphate isomerase